MAKVMPGFRGTALERFERKYIPEPMSGCWLWSGALQGTGYGSFSASVNKLMLAHRWSYENFIGPIPAGLVLDHLCRNRACVNPQHLEAVTNHENILRGAKGRPTHCKHGHPFDEANTYRHPSKIKRDCRICQLARDAKRRQREAVEGRFR